MIYEDRPDELCDDDFLYQYYEEHYNISSIDDHLEDHAEDKLTSTLTDKYNVHIKVRATTEYLNDKVFGKIPTPDDLLKYVYIDNLTITIRDKFTTIDKLEKHLKLLTKVILKDANKIPFEDMDDGVIFSFKCDYQKLGVKGDFDKYCGFVAKENETTLKFNIFDEEKFIPVDELLKEKTTDKK